MEMRVPLTTRTGTKDAGEVWIQMRKEDGGAGMVSWLGPANKLSAKTLWRPGSLPASAAPFCVLMCRPACRTGRCSSPSNWNGRFFSVQRKTNRMFFPFDDAHWPMHT